MTESTLVLPKLGESIVGATVVKWLKKVGDPIVLDEPLVEVSTDKVNSEIPSPVAGILREILAVVDQEIEVGAPLAKIDITDKLAIPVVQAPCTAPKIQDTCSMKTKEDVFSPAVLRMAQIEGISIELLRTVPATGECGRITKRDLEQFIEKQKEVKETATLVEPLPISLLPEERIQMTGMRKAIAENMLRSFHAAPHASLVAEADVTDILKLIGREKERFQEVHGVKLTLTSFLISALTKALQQFPMLNASIDGETIVMKRFVNVGIAVHVEKGLLVPVIKNCQERNLMSIAKALADLSNRARAGKLSIDEVTEGTVTLTNFGMTGALMGVPIIRQPEVAIIGIGAIQKRVVVRDDDSLAIRQMLYLTLTFDHRIIDGVYGCNFLASFKHYLESVSIH